MKYHEVEPITREEAEVAFASGSSIDICHALVRLAYHDPDWRLVQEKCIHFSKYPHPDVAGLAVTCLGHIARIHRSLDLEKVMPVLNELHDDPHIGGIVSDALSDIDIYLRQT